MKTTTYFLIVVFIVIDLIAFISLPIEVKQNSALWVALPGGGIVRAITY